MTRNWENLAQYGLSLPPQLVVQLQALEVDLASAPRLIRFPFAYDTAGLTTGVTVYTPSVGDLIFDFWIRVTAAFNGTTPKADIGTFSGTSGILNTLDGPTPLGVADPVVGSNVGLSWGNTATGATSTSLLASAMNFTAELQGAGTIDRGTRIIPIRCDAATPLKLVVSQTGLKNGAAIGGSAGAGEVLLLLGTPS